MSQRRYISCLVESVLIVFCIVLGGEELFPNCFKVIQKFWYETSTDRGHYHIMGL